mgnify:CR=1 FL=1
MLANLIIGFREGLEAALIIGILAAYLVKLDRKRELGKLWFGVIAAIAVSVTLGVILGVLVENVPEGTNELIAGITSIIAVIFVTWMIFWMAKHSRSLPSEMHNKLANVSSTFAVVSIGFFAVVREGIETSIFLWSATNASEQGVTPIFGAVIGLAVAAGIGYGIYRGSLKLNLRLFFAVTSGFLILVSAGILAYAVMELEELHLFPFLQTTFYDVSSFVTEGSALEIFLKSTLSFNAAPTQLQALIWFMYLLPIATIYWVRTKRK